VFSCPTLDEAGELSSGDSIEVLSDNTATPINGSVWLESITGTSDAPQFNIVVDCGSLLRGRAVSCGVGFYGRPVPFDCPKVGFAPVCGYWKVSQQAWATDGCVAVSLIAGGAIVETTHLTDFALRFAAIAEENRQVFMETLARKSCNTIIV
jgi:hypothetical protein